MFLKTSLVTEDEFATAFAETGGLYFIKDNSSDCIKIGYSREPWTRLSNLQVGNSGRLRMIGIVAAAQPIKSIIHQQFPAGRVRGEWFYDREILSRWLEDITYGEPMCRNVWTLVPGRTFMWSWDENARSHTKHIWNSHLEQWEPPLP